jgi:hypothetical protein
MAGFSYYELSWSKTEGGKKYSHGTVHEYFLPEEEIRKIVQDMRKAGLKVSVSRITKELLDI